MSGFSNNQLKALSAQLEARHVQHREEHGRHFDYLEGWFAIAEANAIFGYGGWDREMVQFACVKEQRDGHKTRCTYLARMRICVRAGKVVVVREGTGFGQATAENAGEAHEQAAKSAETDATKRALATFGNRFGLCLYDRDKAGLKRNTRFCLFGPSGDIVAEDLLPESFCTALRQMMREAGDQLAAWQTANQGEIARLRTTFPELKTRSGSHYADVLEHLFAKQRAKEEAPPADSPAPDERPAGTPPARNAVPPPPSQPAMPANDGPEPMAMMRPSVLPAILEDAALPPAAPGTGPAEKSGGEPDDTRPPPPLMGAEAPVQTEPDDTAPLAPSKIAPGPRIDKSRLAHGTVRRLRDPEHLKFVRTQPCLVCGRQPTHAHHLRLAQTRGLSLKVSDEFTVPLCALHHGELHRQDSEAAWWTRQGLDPHPVAAALWAKSHPVARQEQPETLAAASKPRSTLVPPH